jgi:hypothetical protein
MRAGGLGCAVVDRNATGSEGGHGKRGSVVVQAMTFDGADSCP